MFHALTTIGVFLFACFHAVAASCQLRVGTFNIRCICKSDKGARSWGERRWGLADYANKLKCDVIGFQEVTPSQLDFLKSRMSDYVFVATFRERNRKRDKELPAAAALKMRPGERDKVGGNRIDYIYVSRGVRVSSYETFAQKRKGTGEYFSDHQPVVADITVH